MAQVVGGEDRRRDHTHDHRPDEGADEELGQGGAALAGVQPAEGRDARARQAHREAFGNSIDASGDPPWEIVRATFSRPSAFCVPVQADVPSHHVTVIERVKPAWKRLVVGAVVAARLVRGRADRCSLRPGDALADRAILRGPAGDGERREAPDERDERDAEQRRRHQRLDQGNALLVVVQAAQPAVHLIAWRMLYIGVTTESATNPTTSATPRTSIGSMIVTICLVLYSSSSSRNSAAWSR